MQIAKKILIADNHEIFREGLMRVIARTVDMVVADEAANGQDALEKVRQNDYDMVILDVSMPGRNGLDILAGIKKIRPRLPVLVLSNYPEDQYALRAYRSGADGYLGKESPSLELLAAMQKIFLGKKYVSPAVAEALVGSLDIHRKGPPHHCLSNREFQVMCMIASGKPVSRIASDLSLSVKTISTYRSHVLRKLSMRNNAELTRFALENRLV